MRRILLLAAILGLAGVLGAEEAKEGASYAMGMAVGTSIKETQIKVDVEAVIRGLKDVLDNKATKLTMDEAQALIQKAINEAQAKAGEKAQADGKAYLESNRKKAGVKTTGTGLQYEMLKDAKGPKPKASDTVKVHYEGKLLDGTVFDSSVARNEPAVFPLNGVIPGWTEGLQLMNVGSKYRLTIPSELAYGAQGAGGKIPPNATLVFDVELIAIETATE